MGLSFEKSESVISFRETCDTANKIGEAIMPIVQGLGLSIPVVISAQTLLLVQSHLLAMGMEPEESSRLLGSHFGQSIVQEWVERQTLSLDRAVKAHLQRGN